MSYQQTYQLWCNATSLSPAEREELAAIAHDQKEQESRFFGPLEFGTAGLRGIMGVGLNRMNIHVVRHATQAFANVILAQGAEEASRGVAICFDCRNYSPEFARESACVMAANGIPVRIFESMRPTPELSFAIRHWGAIAGINVTASHNPKEYNGYKVYWEDGAQLPPQHAEEIAHQMAEMDLFADVKTMDFDQAQGDGLVTILGEETDQLFLAQAMAQVNDAPCVAEVADEFQVVFTPFHGTGYQLIPEALTRLGVKHLHCVPEQMVTDGNFPTVASPNPENPASFALAIDLAKKTGANFILGSDPDADRVGILAPNDQGEFTAISGNQTGVLLLHYLIGAKKRNGTMPANPVALKTIVTTEMARAVAQANGVVCFDTFTGFKFMAEKKNALEEQNEGTVIFSYEESYGYMLGDFVRDKDAVTAAVLLTEMAAWYHRQGMTLWNALDALYGQFGHYAERTVNLVMPGVDGLEKMAALMAGLREHPPVDIAGVAVAVAKDYASGVETDCATGAQSAMELHGSNVLRYQLTDGTHIIVRPSGTEPKVKIYILTQSEDGPTGQEKLTKYNAWADTLKK